MFCFVFNSPQRGDALFLEILQYKVDAWSGRSKLLFQLLIPKIHLIYCPQIEDVSDIKLIRTDTTLDLSQKAEKQWICLFCIFMVCYLLVYLVIFFLFKEHNLLDKMD